MYSLFVNGGTFLSQRCDISLGVLLDAGGCRGSPLGVGQFVIFLPFHPSVLKPDFDLPLGETQGVGDLDPPPPGQISVEMKLLLELQNLLPSVSSSGSFGLGSCVIRVHWQKTNRESHQRGQSRHRYIDDNYYYETTSRGSVPCA